MDKIIEIFLVFFIGASIASFFMCGRLKGKSKCDGCERELKWWELVPVVSWLYLWVRSQSLNFVKIDSCKTKCCGQVLSWKYIFGELVLGLWFVGSYLYFDSISLILCLILGCVFFKLVMQDLEDMEVSSKILYLLVALSIFSILIKVPTIVLGDVIWPLIIFSPFWFIYFLGKYLDKPMIGEADPYVFTALGLFFGTQFSISLFLYSIWLGAFIGILYLVLINKKIERNIRIPFLPIIFLACLIILLFNYHVIKISDILIINEIFSNQ